VRLAQILAATRRKTDATGLPTLALNGSGKLTSRVKRVEHELISRRNAVPVREPKPREPVISWSGTSSPVGSAVWQIIRISAPPPSTGTCTVTKPAIVTLSIAA